MDYTVENMDSLRVIGFERDFQFGSSYQEIPEFWAEFNARCASGQNPPDVQRAIEENKVGEFGICLEESVGDRHFHYLIAGLYQGGPVPEGMEARTLPAALWAKFRCRGPMPGALQAVNTKIFSEWLPGNPDYEIAAGLNVEWYSMGDIGAPDYESAVWIPVRKK